MRRVGSFLWVLLAATVLQAHADQRWYVWTYQYLTVPRGEGEIEHYFTLSAPEFGRLKNRVVAEHQFEVEVGMTSRFDFSIYQIFSQEPGGAFQYDGFKLRARYRLAERSLFRLDPLLYAEYSGKADFSEHKLEGKLVLARDIGRLNLSINPIFELENEGEEWELLVGYAVGLSYGISPLFRLGVEFKGEKDAHYAGPVIAHGSEKLWVALGSAFALGSVPEGTAAVELRMILGLGL